MTFSGYVDNIPKCDGCKHKVRCGFDFVCAYHDDEGKTRLSQGVHIWKDGWCKLYEKGEHPRDTRPNYNKVTINSAKAMELYRGGLSDGEIARQMGVRTCDVLNWRRKKQLKPNIKRCRAGEVRGSKLDTPEVMQMYRDGASDREIARRTGMSSSAVQAWRRVRELPANYKGGRDNGTKC